MVSPLLIYYTILHEGLPGVRYCSPQEHVAIWNPNDTMKARQERTHDVF